MKKFQCFAHHLRFLCIVLVVSSMGPRILECQRGIDWKTLPVNLSNYVSVFQCYALVNRMADSIFLQAKIRKDTLAVYSRTDVDQWPQAAAKAAGLCVNRWSASEVPVDDSIAPTLAKLYLIANQDHDVETLVKRFASAHPQSTDTSGIRQLMQLSQVALTARPIRFQIADFVLSLLHRSYLDSVDLAVLERYLIQNSDLIAAAQNLDDTTYSRRASRRIVERMTSLSAEDKETFYVQQTHAAALAALSRQTLDDSLAKSTKEYVAAMIAIQRAAGWSEEKIAMYPLGKKALLIDGSFFVSRDIASPGGTQPNLILSRSALPPIPQLGRVSLLIFLSHKCMWLPYGPILKEGSDVDNCFPVYAILRRLASQFASLDITIVTQTEGFFGMASAPTPSQEAAWLHRYWMGYHRVRANLAVTETEFWKLPEPDGRRIDVVTTNYLNYTFSDIPHYGLQAKNMTAVLIDPDGVIVKYGKLSVSVERSWMMLVEILTDRVIPNQNSFRMDATNGLDLRQ